MLLALQSLYTPQAAPQVKVFLRWKKVAVGTFAHSGKPALCAAHRVKPAAACAHRFSSAGLVAVQSERTEVKTAHTLRAGIES